MGASSIPHPGRRRGRGRRFPPDRDLPPRFCVFPPRPLLDSTYRAPRATRRTPGEREDDVSESPGLSILAEASIRQIREYRSVLTEAGIEAHIIRPAVMRNT